MYRTRLLVLVFYCFCCCTCRIKILKIYCSFISRWVKNYSINQGRIECLEYDIYNNKDQLKCTVKNILNINVFNF